MTNSDFCEILYTRFGNLEYEFRQKILLRNLTYSVKLLNFCSYFRERHIAMVINCYILKNETSYKKHAGLYSSSRTTIF